MKPSLEIVSIRFPDLRERVEYLFEWDEVFRELCGDYAACLEAERRNEVAGPEAIRAEYAALRLQLEAELLRHLEQSPRTPGDPRPGK